MSNTDEAISRTSKKLGVKIREYMVAPIYLDTISKGGHEWLVEFDGQAPDLDIFAEELDQNLQNINSDYEAKRFQDMALKRLEIIDVPPNTFEQWLRNKGKIGAQVKVPRLSNNRTNQEEVLTLLSKNAIL